MQPAKVIFIFDIDTIHTDITTALVILFSSINIRLYFGVKSLYNLLNVSFATANVVLLYGVAQ